MLKKLADLGSAAIASPIAKRVEAENWLPLNHRQKEDLLDLLSLKNGFYAFESALHVLPLSMVDSFGSQDLLRWNDEGLWRRWYGTDADGLFAFAEDLFGNQFCFKTDRVVRFDPETGDSEDVAGSLEEWAGLVCSDFEIQTGWRIAHDWQKVSGPIRPGNRLVPVYPFVTSQGSYELSNLYEVDALKGMLSRADFARQIKHVPEGRAITLVPGSKVK